MPDHRVVTVYCGCEDAPRPVLSDIGFTCQELRSVNQCPDPTCHQIVDEPAEEPEKEGE